MMLSIQSQVELQENVRDAILESRGVKPLNDSGTSVHRSEFLHLAYDKEGVQASIFIPNVTHSNGGDDSDTFVLQVDNEEGVSMYEFTTIQELVKEFNNQF